MFPVTIDSHTQVAKNAKASIANDEQIGFANSDLLADATPQTPIQPEHSKQVAFQTSGGVEHDDPFFVFDRTITDPEIGNGMQRFGSQNKVGVEASVMNGHANQVDDFLVIGAANAARAQYLAGIGQPLTNPQSKWRVSIEEIGVVNGQTRVSVVADSGTDVNFQGLRAQEQDRLLEELWSLDLVGSNPILLDRTQRWFNGLQTHQESPITIYYPAHFGPLSDGDTETDMGKIGPPYP